MWTDKAQETQAAELLVAQEAADRLRGASLTAEPPLAAPSTAEQPRVDRLLVATHQEDLPWAALPPAVPQRVDRQWVAQPLVERPQVATHPEDLPWAAPPLAEPQQVGRQWVVQPRAERLPEALRQVEQLLADRQWVAQPRVEHVHLLNLVAITTIAIASQKNINSLVPSSRASWMFGLLRTLLPPWMTNASSSLMELRITFRECRQAQMCSSQ